MNLDKPLIYAGLEQIFDREFEQLQTTVQETIEEIRNLSDGFEKRLTGALEKTLGTSQKYSKLRPEILRVILEEARSLAFEMESLIESKLNDELQKLGKFATATDRVYRYLNFPDQTLIAGDSLKYSPVINELQKFKMLHKLPSTAADPDGETSPLSAYGAGTLTALFDVYEIGARLADLEFDEQSGEAEPVNDVRRSVHGVIGDALTRSQAARNRHLEVFVVQKFNSVKFLVGRAIDDLKA